METVPVVRMSPKGRVVIPEEVRERLGLKAGAKFVIFEDRDTVILKTLHPPVAIDRELLASETRRFAQKAAMKRPCTAKAKGAVRGRA